jgi:hypothetical protein
LRLNARFAGFAAQIVWIMKFNPRPPMSTVLENFPGAQLTQFRR